MAVFGKQTVGSLTTTVGTGVIFGSKYTLTEAGTITQIGVHLRSQAGGQVSNLGLFADDAGGLRPGTLLASTGDFTLTGGTTPQDYTVNLGTPYVAAAAAYWLIWLNSDASTNGPGYYEAGTDRDYFKATGATTMPNPAPSGGDQELFSVTIWGVYTPAATPPTFDVNPVISGTVQQNRTLHTTTGHANGDATIVYTVQWYRDDYGGGTYAAIPGATSVDYVATIADVDCQLRVTATATNGAGSATANSSATIAVAPATATRRATDDLDELYFLLTL